eukprot:753488-Amorphochlora_amoeboformis.AAC.1
MPFQRTGTTGSFKINFSADAMADEPIPFDARGCQGEEELPSWLVRLRAIRTVKPKFVMLELCKKRKQMLANCGSSYSRSRDNGCTVCQSLCQLSLSGNVSVAILGFLLSRFMQRVGDDLKTTSGLEFKAAAREARKQRASLILGDRDFTLFLGAYFGIRWTGRVRTADESFLRLGSRFPAIIRPLIRERDQYMAHVLRYFVDQGECVVAVVGQAHVKGICEQWEKNINVRRLLDVPQVRYLPQGANIGVDS